jgi:hypothetical protein
MTYQDDPNLRRSELNRMDDRDRGSGAMWVIGAIAAMLVLGIIVWGASGDRSNTASNTQPTASSPATTTGSGSAGSAPPATTTPPAGPAR